MSHLCGKTPTLRTFQAPAGRHDAPTELCPFFGSVNYKYFASTRLIASATALLASHRPSRSLTHEARREPRPPDLRRFCVFLMEVLFSVKVSCVYSERNSWQNGMGKLRVSPGRVA